VNKLGIDQQTVENVTNKEQREIQRRERLYRGEHPRQDPTKRTVILVDDGLATGATMKAAVQALRKSHPRQIVVAVPIAPQQALRELESDVDELICLMTPQPFNGVGLWYSEFPQTSDEEVIRLLDSGS